MNNKQNIKKTLCFIVGFKRAKIPELVDFTARNQIHPNFVFANFVRIKKKKR